MPCPCCRSVAKSCPTLCDPMNCSTPGLPILHYLPEFAQNYVHWVGEAIQPSHPLSSPSIFFSSLFCSIRVFSSELALMIRWPKYWSFSFSINPSNQYSGLISFKIDRFDLLAVQGILKIFSNTTVQKHQFLGAQLSLWSSSHIHTTGKTVALTRCTFVSEVMFLLFNMLSRFVIAFLPRSKHTIQAHFNF